MYQRLLAAVGWRNPCLYLRGTLLRADLPHKIGGLSPDFVIRSSHRGLRASDAALHWRTSTGS